MSDGKKPDAQSENLYGESFDALLETFSDAAGEAEGVLSASNINPVIIGWVRSSIHKLEDCPSIHKLEDCSSGAEEAAEAVLEILPDYAPGLQDLHPGQSISVLTWLHLAERGQLQVNWPHSQEGAPRGVFSCRSPMRPNPIGLHEVSIKELDTGAASVLIRVNGLRAVDGTPVLDIKGRSGDMRYSGEQERAREELGRLCFAAHSSGLLAGFNGNASLRLGGHCLITRSGSLKAMLGHNDFALLDIAGGELLEGARPSSEAALHLEIYRAQPAASLVLHTHPPKLMALGLRLPGRSMEERLAMPVFESDLLRSRLATAPRLEPGGTEIAKAGAAAAGKKQAVWLEGHGLCVWGGSAAEALGLSEELEHLAGVRLAGMRAQEL